MSISFAKTERQQRLLERVSEKAQRFTASDALYRDGAPFPFDNIQALKDVGYTASVLPEELGGESLALYDFLLLQERIAEADGSTALSIGWHIGIMMELVERRNWKHEMFTWFAREVSNGALVNRAASEAQTGSPTRGGKPQTSAYKSGAEWIVTGRKIFTTMAPALDYFLVTASIEDTDEVGEFLVPRSHGSIEIEETWDSIAMQGTASHDLILHDVRLPEEYLVERIQPQTKKKSNGWLLHIPACYLGIARAARTHALEFASSYIPNSINEPIIGLPNVQTLLGQIELELTQARYFMYGVAEKWDTARERDNIGPELAAVKHAATNAAISVVDKSMRIVGARSLSEKNPLQRYYRDVRAGLHNPPMDDATLSLLAKRAQEVWKKQEETRETEAVIKTY
ncbi:acyl-CoA dehydrogenase family protein [Aneurinibacillus migulanus]|uniref:Acyl-CoA dehydrogenase n=1 Tax=Aneurinibacillus migulanus TaxID=47500 RepID=A0A0M0H3F7_ANEMI|nr:acyl-CoA dehydrogenase family protein [Aneurinibacillus migulanus]KON96247.1 acyl-CoA dehydrogenase [Aneurinibacillus migulanus]MED0895462.1 acyl-CoA/acyl-ACP dehydrogenase [Aneurinibacillus migulanus]MED1618376.1 acyl-CoA/acyl-ACP dehydrogenase [Aneurinibacillus migulanus]SDI76986.1 Acyl-CoA dehydrogenase [Aneurinibacillus migulanus]GED13674.1 acyl-CoA dehydrogenase [Aneurinibacillus migulanus]